MEKKMLTIPQMIFTILFILLALLCILYGITILSANSGSKFYMVWLVGAAVMGLLAAMTYFRLFAKIPAPLRTIAIIILSAAFLYFAFTQILILRHFHEKAPENLDYIIVLGAQMRGDYPSRVLKFRLDCAIEYLNANPNTVCIVSGGQGANEIMSEAEGMKKYLLENNIPEDRILIENRSRNTIENILFSKELLKDETSSVGILTNNFHSYRSVRLAKAQLQNPIYGISASSSPRFLPNNMLRETVGITKDTLLGNMTF